MLDLQIQKLRQDYSNRYVVLESDRPESRRFQGRIGLVKTITMNCQALVEWVDSADRAWYAFDLDDLRLVDRPVRPTSSPR